MPTTTPHPAITPPMTPDNATRQAASATAPPPNRRKRLSQAITRRAILALHGDEGMSTTEYAIGTLSAAAFAALLYVIVSGDTVSGALEDLFERALNTSVG